MLARTLAATPWGVEARPVRIEVDVRHGLPSTQIVGLPDTTVRESRDRVRTAVRNCGFEVPPRVVVINLAPADLRKQGCHLDLGIATALLAAHGHIEEERLAGRMLVGELGLDGTVRPVRGALSVADLARRSGCRELLVPAANATEAAALCDGAGPALTVTGVEDLTAAVAHLTGSVREIARIANVSPGTVQKMRKRLKDTYGDPAVTRWTLPLGHRSPSESWVKEKRRMQGEPEDQHWDEERVDKATRALARGLQEHFGNAMKRTPWLFVADTAFPGLGDNLFPNPLWDSLCRRAILRRRRRLGLEASAPLPQASMGATIADAH